MTRIFFALSVMIAAALCMASATPVVAKAAPLDIYLVLDTSPSMLIPTTSTGIRQLQSATETEKNHALTGCAYACHVSSGYLGNGPRDRDGHTVYLDKNHKRISAATPVIQDCLQLDKCDNSRAPDDPGMADGFWVARNYGSIFSGGNIELRIDAETKGSRVLLAWLRQRDRQIRLEAFRFGMGDPTRLSGPMAPVATLGRAAIPDLAKLQPEWFAQMCPTRGHCNDDEATDFNRMFKTLSVAIRSSGRASRKVVLLATDGMSDEAVNGQRWVGELTPDHLAQCTALKARGIQIAILYLEYATLPLKGDSWSQSMVVPHLPRIEPALARCASSGPDGKPLLVKVGMDQSIPKAFVQLAEKVVSR